MDLSPEQWESARSEMNNIDPEALIAQARMMKNSDKATIRRMNPQFANMSDSEIDAAATQMEFMASNPAMMDMARQQMKGMSHSQATQQMAAATRGKKKAALTGASGYTVGDRVSLKGLGKAPQHNGKHGTVVGSQGDRIKVLLDTGSTTLALKPDNLTRVGPATAQAAQTQVEAADDFPDVSLSTQQLKQATAAMKNADPEQLRAQANAMRNMDPGTVRRMNPQMAHMSDAQIRSAADQMEMMASNPEMMKMAMRQMEQMSPQQLEQQMKAMQQMSPQQRREMQGMAADMVAGGPQKGAKKAAGATAALDDGPPPLGDALAQDAGPAGMMGGMDAAAAAKMMENIDEGQLEGMLNMVKSNPDMFKTMMKANPMMGGLSDETIEQQLEMLDKLDPKQLKKIMGYAQTAQKAAVPLLKAYSTCNKWCGGRLKEILLVAALSAAVLVLKRVGRYFFGGAAIAPDAQHETPSPLDAVLDAVLEHSKSAVLDDDEFAEIGAS